MNRSVIIINFKRTNTMFLRVFYIDLKVDVVLKKSPKAAQLGWRKRPRLFIDSDYSKL
jgi:hypothetical protein